MCTQCTQSTCHFECTKRYHRYLANMFIGVKGLPVFSVNPQHPFVLVCVFIVVMHSSCTINFFHSFIHSFIHSLVQLPTNYHGLSQLLVQLLVSCHDFYRSLLRLIAVIGRTAFFLRLGDPHFLISNFVVIVSRSQFSETHQFDHDFSISLSLFSGY